MTLKSELTDKYMFILPVDDTEPLCLICCESVMLIKSRNVKQHKTKHRSVLGPVFFYLQCRPQVHCACSAYRSGIIVFIMLINSAFWCHHLLCVKNILL